MTPGMTPGALDFLAMAIVGPVLVLGGVALGMAASRWLMRHVNPFLDRWFPI